MGAPTSKPVFWFLSYIEEKNRLSLDLNHKIRENNIFIIRKNNNWTSRKIFCWILCHVYTLSMPPFQKYITSTANTCCRPMHSCYHGGSLSTWPSLEFDRCTERTSTRVLNPLACTFQQLFIPPENLPYHCGLTKDFNICTTECLYLCLYCLSLTFKLKKFQKTWPF